jgi:hypothetical protein
MSTGDDRGDTATRPTGPSVGIAGAEASPTEDDITRALDRLTKARIRLRDAAARVPAAGQRRIESIERAHRAVIEAAAAADRLPDEPEVVKTHALAEIAEIMALRREGFLVWADYDAAVSPPTADPAVADALRRAEEEWAAAQSQWDALKDRLVDRPAGGSGGGPVLDLTRDEPVIEA